MPIADWESLALKPMATPGLLLVDSNGTILKIWLGLLNQSGEAEVMNAIDHPSEVSNPPRALPSGEAMISGADVQTLAKTEAMNILNVNERQMFRAMQYNLKVSNIPLDELQLRAGRELRRSELQVVDCTDAPIMACVAALQRLDLQGFRALALDDAMGVLTEANRR